MTADNDKPVDTANEPVTADEDEFMDTGVLHEPKKKPVRGAHAEKVFEDDE